MPLREPKPGLVIRYSYLWYPEAQTGIEEGRKDRLNLDSERNWIVTSEVNRFLWPGPDLRPVDSRHPEKGIVHGYLPSSLAQKVIEAVRDEMHKGRARAVKRTGE